MCRDGRINAMQKSKNKQAIAIMLGISEVLRSENSVARYHNNSPKIATAIDAKSGETDGR